MKDQARHSAIHKTPQNNRSTSSTSKNFGPPKKKKDLHFLFYFSVSEKSILYNLNHDLPRLSSDGPRTSPTSEVGASTYMDIDLLSITPCYRKGMAADDFSFLSYYRPQGKVMFSQVSVILSIIGLMVTRLLLIFLQRGRYAYYWNAFL